MELRSSRSSSLALAVVAVALLVVPVIVSAQIPPHAEDAGGTGRDTSGCPDRSIFTQDSTSSPDDPGFDCIPRSDLLLEIADEGSSLTKREVLNFVGPSISCADDAGNERTNCTLTDDDAPDSDAEVPNGITVDLGSSGHVTGGTASKCARFNGSGELVPASGDCSSGDTDTTGYDTAADEGSTLTQRHTLNFVGPSISCADDAGNARTNCTLTDDDSPDNDGEVPNGITVDLSASGTVTGGTSSRCARFDGSGVLVPASGDCGSGDTGITLAYQTLADEGSSLTQRSTINFVGASITCTDNAGNTRTDCTLTDDDSPDNDGEVPNGITVDLASSGHVTGGTASKCARFNGSGELVAASGDCSSGDSTATGANPTAAVGFSANNGAASTFMRSDASPAIDTAAYSTTPDASKLVRRDSDGNVLADAFSPGYLETASTSGGTLTLTADSMQVQRITGIHVYTVKLPVVSTLTVGHTFVIVDSRTNPLAGPLTVQSSGSNTVATINLQNQALVVTCISTSGTGASSWLAQAAYLGADTVYTANVVDGQITYADVQDVSASRLLGRGSAGGSGDTQELSVSGACAISGTVLSCTDTGGLILARLASNSTTNTDATLTDETALNLSLAASTNYRVSAMFHVTQDGGTADFKFSLDVPTGATMNVAAQSTSASASDVGVTSTDDGAVTLNQPVNDAVVLLSGTIRNGVNAGTLITAWAQGTSNGNNTTLNAGSFVSLETY